MNVEKRLKELGLQSYGGQVISLTVEYGWFSIVNGGDPGWPSTDKEYRLRAKLFMWLENGQSMQCEGDSIDKVLDKAEKRLGQYKKDKELCELRRKLGEIHQLSACTA
jgi:hypothetical protein